MLIRKNTKAYKTILEIVTACKVRVDREKLVRLYITRAGHTINERISVEGIQGDAAVFYEMGFQNILNYLQSSNHQLHQSDEIPGIYFFRGAANKVWDEAPFEFDEAVAKEFTSLPELPAVRKKGKAEKFVLPVASTKSAGTKVSAKPKDQKVEVRTLRKVIDDEPTQPNYKLKRKIVFTDLERVIYRQPKKTKKDVLDYYNSIADHILPYLKDRALSARFYSEKIIEMNVAEMFDDGSTTQPGWVETEINSKGKGQKQLLLCNDKDHLLFYSEKGCLQFDASQSRVKANDLPDLIVIVLDSKDPELGKVVDVALATKEILDGLKLPGFVKTDGSTALHIYIPLDSKSKFDRSKDVAEYICKLIRVKVPELTAMEGTEDDYGKVFLQHSLNEPGKKAIVPYSLLSGSTAVVATPLEWDELSGNVRPDDYNIETMVSRLKKHGDPFDGLFRKKVNASELLQKLEESYSFLF